mgnify:CR=1 FL=1
MYPFLKRFIDILVALLALIVLSPILIPVIIILKLTGEHEVFYLQKRIGYRNQPFYIWKFATMLKNSPNLGAGIITLRNDPRVTPVGRFLRKTKINELPQLINVLKGDMSIVGPRPEVKKYVDLYTAEQQKVLSVKPGITDPVSIRFFNENEIIARYPDPEEGYIREVMPEKLRLNLEYIDHQSFSKDFAIVIKTIARIFS